MNLARLAITGDPELIHTILIDLVNPESMNTLIFTMDDNVFDDPDTAFLKNCKDRVCGAGILLPPPNIMLGCIDNEMTEQETIQAYMEYLRSPDIIDYVSVMMRAMMCGVNILVYTRAFPIDSVFMTTLITYFQSEYGILIGTDKDHPSMYNNRYDVENACKMYLRNYINPVEFFICIPFDILPQDPMVIQKLAVDFAHCYGPGETLLSYIQTVRQGILYGVNPLKAKPAFHFL